ncbi:MAG TPA: response regulator [Verrucomicrobiae bacterium]|jgi:DNA-binding response OmpR family regulator|nr:response regulator [Verrucomicrobiae bacterium]
MKKILLTDDEPNIVKVVSARLKAHNYEVIPAYDGESALDAVYREKPDLILLDIMLPKLDGYKVCQKLKSDPKWKEVPIILFSAKTQAADKQTGREYGADAYIAKPFQPEQLLETIKYLLKE